MDFNKLLLKIAKNEQLTPQELDDLSRYGTETQQRNSFLAGNITPASLLKIAFPVFPIYSEILEKNTTSILVNIPSNANHLLIMGSVRTNRAASYNDGFIGRFNGDSGGNYREVYDGAQNTTQIAGQTAAQTFFGVSVTTAESATAGSFGGFFLFVPHIRSGTWKQTLRISGTSQYGATDMFDIVTSCHWQSTAKIQDITFSSENSADILAGSLLSVYGII